MKRTLLFLIVTSLSSYVMAQSPVQWNYSAKKTADKTYEVHLTATVAGPWHIYSQFTPDGGPLPTTISFSKNPLVSLQGAAKEVGKLKQKHEEVFDVDVKYFKDQVTFIQVIKLKSNVKTSLGGTVEFMLCNDEQCLPSAKENFSIKLE